MRNRETGTHSGSLDILILLLTRVRRLSARSSLPDFYRLLVLVISDLLRGELHLSRLFGNGGIVLVLDVGFLRSGNEDVRGLGLAQILISSGAS